LNPREQVAARVAAQASREDRLAIADIGSTTRIPG